MHPEFEKSGLGDVVSARWLRACGTPYLEEIERLASEIGVPGVMLLNNSYEWACSSGVTADARTDLPVLFRTLDWKLRGLGESLVAADWMSPRGPFVALTWPGFAGLLTGMAPGRFAAAINQAPIRKVSRWMPIDWFKARVRVWQNPALPPVHLLRKVFETCESYAEAREAPASEPVAMPVFFSLVGTKPGEGCIIERTEDEFAIREMPAMATNHWISMPIEGHPRGFESRARLDAMRICRLIGDDLSDIPRPILNRDTRLVCRMVPGAGSMTARAHEGERPVSSLFVVGGNASS